QQWDENVGRCYVVKDAGDDPDVTHGAEVHAEISFAETVVADPCVCPVLPGPGGRTDGFAPTKVVIEGGPGVGRVTKPGLAVAVGEWAINPVPRRMIAEAVLEVFPPHSSPFAPQVTLSIPDGLKRARRTLNERLGIIGGLSILGTTGVVKPISHKAWTDTLDVALDVALACGCSRVILCTGRSSEKAAQEQLPDRSEAFVMMGDHVGYALEACHRRGIREIILAVQFAKLVKIACGHAQTHVSSSRLDLEELASWGRNLGLDQGSMEAIECANTAREVRENPRIPQALFADVAQKAILQCSGRAPGSEIKIMLVGYNHRIQCFGPQPVEPAEKDER
ncbi:MAG: cobalt-precorrin-5B (C(1))-methyltransferase CbiD, partial [Desulfuromonadales bacterium]